MKLKIDFYLSDKARNEAFIATGDRPSFSRRVEFDMATEATAEQRAALLEKFGSPDQIELHDYTRKQYGNPATLELDADPAWPEAFALLMAEADAKAAFKAAEKERVDREAAARAEAERRTVERQAAEREAAEVVRKLVEQARANWINAHGSEYLQRAYARGHDCQRLYVSERAALELPGYVVDFRDNAQWRDRSCPSVESLDEADRVERLDLRPADEIEVIIVWLTSPAHAERPDEYSDEEFEASEAVVVRGYLGKYDLVRQM